MNTSSKSEDEDEVFLKLGISKKSCNSLHVAPHISTGNNIVITGKFPAIHKTLITSSNKIFTSSWTV